MSEDPYTGEDCYLDMLIKCVDEGERKSNRTGVDTFVLPPQWFVHNMHAEE